MTVVAVRGEAALMREEATRRGMQTLRALAAPCSVALARRQDWELDSLLDRVAATEGRDLDLQWIGVIDSRRQVLAHTDPERFGVVVEDPFTTRASTSATPLNEIVSHDGRPYLRLSMPVTTGTFDAGIRWGTMTAEISLDRLDDRLVDRQVRLLVANAAGIVLTALLLWFLLSRLVIEPITRLSLVASHIADGDLEARVDIGSGRDELAVLGTVFNQMVARLQDSNRQLEDQVVDRTARLRQANDELELTNQRLSNLVGQLEQLARTDGLTGLLNHRTIKEHLAFEFARSKRTTHPLSVIMLDVDHFKLFNDAHGHPAGDEVLRVVAEILRGQLRATDLVARYGGEEFCIILLDTPKPAAEQVAEKIRSAVEEVVFDGARTSQPEGRLTVSLGLASYPEDADGHVELLERADKALYKAKRAGRNRVCTLVPGEIVD